MKISKLGILIGFSFFFFIFFAQAMPVTDTVECNYALPAKEMVVSADWISPRIYGQYWYDKPIMIYWLLALAIKLMGYSDLALRMVPALFGAFGVGLIYWFLAKLNRERLGRMAALLMATSFQYFVIAKLLITDIMLFDFNAAALIFFYLGFKSIDERKRWYLPMYVCFGLAVLTKGPVGILLPGLVILLFLAWKRQWPELRNMHIFSGLLLFLAVALPWYLMMYLKHGAAFLETFFGIHNYLRAMVSEHPRDNVFYYYFLLFALSTLPWTGIMLGGIKEGIKRFRSHNDLAEFLILWIVVFFIFYSLMATKYPTYTFPILFPVAVLAVLYLEAKMVEKSFFFKIVLLWPLLLWQVLLAFTGIYFFRGALTGAYIVSTSIVLAMLIWQLFRGKVEIRIPMQLYGVALVYLLLSAMVLPGVAQSSSGKQLAQALEPYSNYNIGTYHFFSTSAVYYRGKLLERLLPLEKINVYRDSSLSWNAKYAEIPMATIADFVTRPGRNKLIVIRSEDKQKFLKETAGISLKQVSRKGDKIFYKVLE